MKKKDQDHQEPNEKQENQADQGNQDQSKQSNPKNDEGTKAGEHAQEAVQPADLDHKQLGEFSKKMDADDAMRSEFQVDPHGTLKKHGVALPQGYRASYDHQFVKSSDGSDRVSHSYGPMRIEK